MGDRVGQDAYRATNPFRDRMERVLIIDTGPDRYRLDYVVPYTVVAISNTGQRVLTTSGGFVRDDRDALRDIARAAQEWYATPRNALEISYRQTRNLFDIGQLITDVGDNYTLQNVNSVVTSIEYGFPRADAGGGNPVAPTTTIPTSFVELDLA